MSYLFYDWTSNSGVVRPILPFLTRRYLLTFIRVDIRNIAWTNQYQE